jgi:trigger factor
MTKIEVKEIHPCRRELTIQVPSEIMERELESACLKLGRSRRIPGFRPGKAPLKILKKHLKEEARSDTIKDQVWAGYLEGVKEHELKVVGDPEFGEINWPEGGDLQFGVTVDIRPALEVDNYRGINIKRKKDEVDDKEIDQTLDDLQGRSAIYETEDARPLAGGDWALVSYRPGNKPDQEWTDGGLLEIDLSQPDGIGAQMVGLEPGQTRMTKIPVPEGAKQDTDPAEFEVRLQEVKKKVLPEITDEWAKSWGEFPGVAELREQIRKDIAMRKDLQARREMEEQIVDGFLKKYSFDLPPALLDSLAKEHLKDLNRYAARLPVPEDENHEKAELEKIARKKAEDELRLHYIMAEIIREEKIEADPASIADELSRLAAERGVSPAELRKELDESGRIGVIIDRILRSRAMDFLIENAKIKYIN